MFVISIFLKSHKMRQNDEEEASREAVWPIYSIEQGTFMNFRIVFLYFLFDENKTDGKMCQSSSIISLISFKCFL